MVQNIDLNNIIDDSECFKIIVRLKRIIVFCITFFVLANCAFAQNYVTRYYKQIKIVDQNKKVQIGDNSGQFITFNDKGCYDSDKSGYEVKNGFLKYKGNDNGYNTYYGSSFWGTATYFFLKDYSRLNIVLEATDITYVYELTTPPANVNTCSLIKETQPVTSPANPISSVVVNPITPIEGNNNGTTSSSTNSRETMCKSCNGTGKCTMCGGYPKKTCSYCDGRGRKVYGSGSNVEYSRCAVCNGTGYTLCAGCKGSGNCGVCRGSGKIR
jgi:hypothetical protein